MRTFKVITYSLALALASAPGAARARSHDPAEWEHYKERFISPEGRVVDTGNHGISHSEGQGFGMLLSVHHDDRATFDRLWAWAHTHLQVRPDHLFAWKWSQEAGVEDTNNATDADLIIAWALFRAAHRWSDAGKRALGLQITQDVRARLIKRHAGMVYLLPGVQGFEHPDGDVVNLSYWVYPALNEFRAQDPRPEWDQLTESGRSLLRQAQFGRWALPPDWLKLSSPLAPAPGFKPRFGYDAVRIPLYLRWAGNSAPDLLQPFQAFWSYFRGAPFLPAWTDLLENSVDSFNASPGIRAIAQVTSMIPGPLPVRGSSEDYYSASLRLLTEMMRDDLRRP